MDKKENHPLPRRNHPLPRRKQNREKKTFT
jgi:hypothetical protein